MATLFGFARLPELDERTRASLAERFEFTRLAVPSAGGAAMTGVRPVNPSFNHISGWISAVGGAIALNDLDGDGLPNDLCHVETRTNQVMVAPVPETGARYSPMTLSPEPLDYDSDTMAPMGCLPGDLNEDGRMDLLVYYWGRAPVAFLRTGQGYRPVEVVDGSPRWFTNAATLADLDGDGHMDLIVANYFRDGARILDATATAPDEMQHSMSRAYNAGGTFFLRFTSATGGDSTLR